MSAAGSEDRKISGQLKRQARCATLCLDSGSKVRAQGGDATKTCNSLPTRAALDPAQHLERPVCPPHPHRRGDTAIELPVSRRHHSTATEVVGRQGPLSQGTGAPVLKAIDRTSTADGDGDDRYNARVGLHGLRQIRRHGNA